MSSTQAHQKQRKTKDLIVHTYSRCWLFKSNNIHHQSPIRRIETDIKKGLSLISRLMHVRILCAPLTRLQIST